MSIPEPSRTLARQAAAGLLVAVLALSPVPSGTATPPASCGQAPQAAWQTLDLDTGTDSRALHYYSSLTSTQAPDNIRAALIAVHGYRHDANVTFNAAAQATQEAGALATTLVVAPLFQVDSTGAAGFHPCTTAGVPGLQPGDITWTCGGWSDGEAADLPNTGLTVYAAMDRLIAQIVAAYPSITRITVAGFSDGGQMVQRYAALATPPTGTPLLRFVVSDPGSWLYFDPVRPYPAIAGRPARWSDCDHASDDGLGDCNLAMLSLQAPLPEGWRPPSACTAVDWQARSNEWKYGTDALPPALGSSAARMRSAYRTAEISYLVGRDDDSTAATFSVLDKSCPAELQGDYRLQRGLGYAEYDRSVLAGATHAVTIVHHCAHDVCCVLTAPEARPALFPRSP